MGLMTGFIMATTTFVDLLNTWESYGMFSHFLPFLLIFALIFGILTKSKVIGDNKGVITILSVVLGLLALQYDLVPRFFGEIAPMLGIGIIILLVALILMGLFIDWEEEKWGRYVFFGIGAIITLVVVFNSLAGDRWQFGFWWDQWGALIIGFLITAIIIGAVIAFSGKEGKLKAGG